MDQENVLQFIINLSVEMARLANDHVNKIDQMLVLINKLEDDLLERIKLIEARADLGIRNDETITKLLNWMMVQNYKNKEIVTTSNEPDTGPTSEGWAAIAGESNATES